MINRLIRLGGVTLVAAAVSGALLVAAGAQSDAPEAKPMSGIWALNVEASENPSGAEKPSSCASTEGRGRRGGGRGGGGSTGESLGVEETARFCATLSQFYEAPAMMGLQVTESDFLQLLDPTTNFGYKHVLDNKSQEVVTPGGPVEFKVKWDKEKVVREINNPDSLNIKEEYSMSADGQLIVTLEASSRMMRMPDPKIRRVYDRRQ